MQSHMMLLQKGVEVRQVPVALAFRSPVRRYPLNELRGRYLQTLRRRERTSLFHLKRGCIKDADRQGPAF